MKTKPDLPYLIFYLPTVSFLCFSCLPGKATTSTIPRAGSLMDQIIYIALAVICTSLTVACWLLTDYRKKKKIQIEQNLRIASLLEEIDKKQKNMLVQKQLSEDTFRSSRIYQLLQANCRNPEFKMQGHWAALQEQVNASYPQFTERLYMLCPKLSETELRVSLLIKARISLKEIARLLYKEKNSISNIRKRLYEKTHGKKGKAEQWDKFILDL